MFMNRMTNAMRRIRANWNLPKVAKDEANKDRAEGIGADIDIDRVVSESVAWLCRAQDQSTSHDGGVARDYNLIRGWGPSYPETTGYIIPTILARGLELQDQKLIERARRMLDWLLQMQFPEGGFQGGTVGCNPIVPVTFNTGQILIGLASGAVQFGEPYLNAMHQAAGWLVRTQDADGAWRAYPTPFASYGEKTYETHVAWGLFEAAKAGREKNYAEAAMKNIDWALTKQRTNGWFSDCCLEDPSQPLTHTLGYAIRGILEAYQYAQERSLIEACIRASEGILTAMKPNGFIPGRLDSDWNGTVSWACLTGNVQVAYCWLKLYQYTKETRFRDAAYSANSFVRRTIRLHGKEETRGAVKGSFPISGDYAPYQYLNWAAKFFIDSNQLELVIRRAEA